MVEISLSPHLHHIFHYVFTTSSPNLAKYILRMNGRNIFHYIFTTSSLHLHQTLRNISCVSLWSKYLSLYFANELSKYILRKSVHYILRMNGRNIFITRLAKYLSLHLHYIFTTTFTTSSPNLA